jgi:hypothetical protein
MNHSGLDYLTVSVLGEALATTAALVYGLHRALNVAGWQARARKRAVWGLGALLLAWFVAALSLSWFGFFGGVPNQVPTIQYGVLIPIVAGIALFWRSSTLRRAVEAVPLHWIVTVQLYRVLGLIFLVLHAAGRMPGEFAWPAGVGDVTVGLLAPAVGLAYAHGSRRAAGLVRAWNLLGIVDLIVALTMGFLTSPSPLQKFAFGTPNELISAFPLVMVPVFLVPLSILLHLAVLKKLQQAEPGRQVPRPLLVSE